MTTQGYRPDSRWGIPEDLTGYVAYDIEKAKLEVEQYKADTGQPTLSFTLIGLTSIEDSMLMQALQQQWAEAGIEAKIDAIDQVKYITTIAVGYFQAAWFRWYGSPNPDGNVGYHSSETAKPLGQLSINFTHYSSETMDKNLTIQRESDDFATRKKANDDIIKESNAAAINLWLFDTPYSIIASKKVRGLNSLRTHPFGNFTSKPWWGEYWIQS
jgi:ABC-type transport system substrate-binding protein